MFDEQLLAGGQAKVSTPITLSGISGVGVEILGNAGTLYPPPFGLCIRLTESSWARVILPWLCRRFLSRRSPPPGRIRRVYGGLRRNVCFWCLCWLRDTVMQNGIGYSLYCGDNVMRVWISDISTLSVLNSVLSLLWPESF